MRHGIIVSFFVCSLALFGCSSPDDEIPPERSSYELRMDGTHWVPNIGVPTRFDTLSLPSEHLPTTAPLLLNTIDSEHIVIAEGRSILLGSEHQMRLLARSSDSTDITELLADSSFIYAIHFDGAIEKFSFDGKIVWHSNMRGMPKPGSVLTNNVLVVANDSSVVALAKGDASLRWSYHPALVVQSLCYDEKNAILYTALTGNDADGTDSVVCFKNDGSVISRTGFSHTRITSNLTRTANNKLAFGYLGTADKKTLVRAGHIALWSNISTQSPKREWDHELPYIVTGVSANASLVLSSGFRETSGDLTSGVDAFRLDDTGKYWQRRFVYPVVMPVTVSKANAYIPFVFTTQAQIPAKTVLVSLDITDGSTVKELPVTGAMEGFIPSVGMPVDGMLVYADRIAPRIYFLKP